MSVPADNRIWATDDQVRNRVNQENNPIPNEERKYAANADTEDVSKNIQYFQLVTSAPAGAVFAILSIIFGRYIVL